MLCSPQATWKTGLSVSLENTSQKMFIGNDKIVNESDTDGSNCNEISENTCKVRLVPMAAGSMAVHLLQLWVQILPGE
jgi:hypothetical protein